ncbi:FKBP-type peptidyl-prolyl isomerase-like protein [Chitinophaga skermanii]|uniref:Peptidyl-prolyl cis-trans isomerase n=1 Tax=Chitinophaga skermanii TaxID=331697 RepID=A0A327QQC3_9BACT|nr:FKBP-type peptidyl-prolyl cis-trans isomerase [Chitinophaga skermanii]RAJ06769.1 FKBP-type peptidyl-prolyl isomerase-like protein [Chitinophaga skermanii]
MKKKHLLLVAAVALGITVVSCGGSRGKKGKTSGGFEYTILKSGDGEQLKVGDTALMYINQKINDSMLLDSRKESPEPIPISIVKSTDKFDLMDGLASLRVGDSAVFSIPVDSLPQLPFFAKKGDKINLTFTVAGKYSTADQVKKDEKEIDEYIKKNNSKATKTADGIYVEIKEEGKGPKPAAGDTVSVFYTGRTLDGKMFDSNTDSSMRPGMPLEALKFPVGMGYVIKGWDLGLAGLTEGTKAHIIIPSPLAYGFRGSMPMIKPNTVLTFDVYLQKVTKGQPVAPAAEKADDHAGHNH